MVTFDKGGRVPRLEPGATLDDRQVGILISQLDGQARSGHLDDWDQDHDPAATKRIEGLLGKHGPTAKPVLLIALSMSVLKRFTVIEHDAGRHVVIEGNRHEGYRVTDIAQGTA